jgi:GTPase SAR1 family protein
MKTLLSRFCEEFDEALRPVLAPLREFAGALAATPHPQAAQALPGVQEVSHQLRVLAEKVAEQQAYVLIFGPLKSGKSTLMNSIAAAYVSEVTALPAYPCLVYVSHSEAREFVVTRYNGDTQTFSGPASMRMQVNRDHADLAERIRRAESEGRDFDPVVHFPEAIRRIDVKVPAPELVQSGAVLVDTPGLYSRMKFGYDRMTRDFRSSAACAIFVVKTDNLFLEQVFAEFNELLELFSRIFLVVNLDSTKMDLRPDGSLAPSLEREDPVRVIEAFETLAMNAPIKRALDEGRLKLFPVDLLRAASRRLQRAGQGDAAAASRALESAKQTASNDTERPRDEFEAFLLDLTEYLNSTDYLHAFLGDSLRRARQLVSDAQGLARSQGLVSLERRASELARDRERLRARRDAVQRLMAADWNEAFEHLGDGLAERAAARAPETGRRLADDTRQAVDAWFRAGTSLAALLEEDLAPKLERFQSELAGGLEGELRARVQDATGGALLPEEVARDLDRLGLRLGDLAASGLLAVLPSGAVQNARLAVDVAALPVRRTWVDWLLLRRRAAVRRNLLGPDRQPDQPITRGDKERRLGEPARGFLLTGLGSQIDAFAPAAAERVARKLAGDYTGALRAALEQRLNATGGELRAELEGVETELNRIEALAGSLASLRGSLEGADRAVEGLDERYRSTPAEVLVLPVEEALAGSADNSDTLEPAARRSLPRPPKGEERAETPSESSDGAAS